MERIQLIPPLDTPKVIWNSQKDRFELEISTTVHKEFALKYGYREDGRTGVFFTRSAELASYFSLATAQVKQLIQQHQTTKFLSRGIATENANIPCPTGLSYLQFQTCGIQFALARKRVLIADEQGLGKTIQAIGVMNASPDIKSVLVICPAVIKSKWIRELQKWFMRMKSVGIGYLEGLPNTNIVVINYDIIAAERLSLLTSLEQERKWEELRGKKNTKTQLLRQAEIQAVKFAQLSELRRAIGSRHWDLGIIDEAQYLQNSDASRTLGVLGGQSGKIRIEPIEFDRTIFLSGTPMVNRPENLWTLIKACDPQDLGANWEYYGTRYCAMWRAPWGMDSSGARNLPELKGRLRGSFMIRRLKAWVLKDLPPKKRRIITLQAPPEVQQLLQTEEKLVQSSRLASKLEKVIEVAEAAIEAAAQKGDWEDYKKAAKKLAFEQPDFTELARIRKEVAVAKLPYLIEYISLMLNTHKKVVVFLHHYDVITPTYEFFKSKVWTVTITGQDDETKRQTAIDTFEENIGCRLAIASLTVCVGFELVSSAYGLFGELDWRSSVLMQCEDRLHRIGQNSAVDIDYLVFNNSTDARQVKLTIEKQTNITEALD